MPFDWFPGHMLAAQKAAADTLTRSDVIIEVLDARVPRSSCNPLIEHLRQRAHRPALKILNKTDLADPGLTREWLAHYNAMPSTRAIGLCAKSGRDVARIPRECLRLVPTHPGGKKPLRMMILGIPNVGKSTLMNTLLGRQVAKVGDEPGITRVQTRHEISPTATIIDTAGMLWPRVADAVAMKLAATNNVGVNSYDTETAATTLAVYLLRAYRDRLAGRFGELTDGVDGPGLIAHIAKRRSLVIKGGAPDLHKAALVLLNDFRSGALGGITLDTFDEVLTADGAPDEDAP